MNSRQLVPFALTLCVLGGCAPTALDKPGVTNDGAYVSGTGSVAHFDLEGGFWAIKGDDHMTYDPINLDPSYRVEGLRVRFRAVLRKDLLGIHQVGPIIEILEIKRL